MSQSQSDALVEAVARAACKAAWSDAGDDWNDADDCQQREFRRVARAVIPIIEAEALERAADYIQEYGPSDTIGNWEAAGAIRSLKGGNG